MNQLLDRIQELQKKTTPKTMKVLKTESEELGHNTVTFVVLEPETIDYNGDVITANEIIKTAHEFMLNLQDKNLNVNHEAGTEIDPDDAKFVESFILPMDLEFEEGTVLQGSWLVAIKFTDDLFEKILSGEIIGVSMEGVGIIENIK